MAHANVFWASYMAWAVLEVWVFLRDRRPVAGRSADRGSLWTVVAALFVSLFAAFWARAALPQARITAAAPIVFWTGIVLVWAGVALRLWAIATLGRFFRVTVVVQDAHELVTRGPYRLLRHPAYAGSILSLIGIGLAFTNWVSLAAMTAGVALAYVWRIPAEEQALAAHFGEAWAEHRRRTWRIAPFVW